MLLAQAAHGIVHVDDDDEEGTDEGDENDRKLGGRPEQDGQRHPGQRRNRPQQLDHRDMRLREISGGCQAAIRAGCQATAPVQIRKRPARSSRAMTASSAHSGNICPNAGKPGRAFESLQPSATEANQQLPKEHETAESLPLTPGTVAKHADLPPTSGTWRAGASFRRSACRWSFRVPHARLRLLAFSPLEGFPGLFVDALRGLPLELQVLMGK